MKPRFSVIMPLFNKERYVKKAIESVIAQTYCDFELIIIDDGSTDNSADICEKFSNSLILSSSNPIRLLKQSNRGVAAARNNGVAASKGKYLCFLDADDWWEPTFLEEMDRLIKEYPNAGIYCTNYIYYKPGKTHVALKLERGYMNYPTAYLHGEMPVWTGAACMPRRVFDEMGGFPIGIKLGEDFLLWAETALHYPVAFCEKPLAYYNNDVPAHLRATRNLHAPAHHMLFHLDPIEEEINRLQYAPDKAASWRLLLDKLRVNGLLDYWLSNEYHEAAKMELTTVQWNKQSYRTRCRYQMPLLVLKQSRNLMRIGSYVKQCIVKCLCYS